MMNKIPGFKYVLIDCRYPYEYDGGHFLGAVNIYTLKMLLDFLGTAKKTRPYELILIFHCEFSTHRAPRLLQSFRNEDRKRTKLGSTLHYPYCFLLEGGFSAFWETYSLCHAFFSKDAQYVRMDDERFKEKCQYYHHLYHQEKRECTGLKLRTPATPSHGCFQDSVEDAFLETKDDLEKVGTHRTVHDEKEEVMLPQRSQSPSLAPSSAVSVHLRSRYISSMDEQEGLNSSISSDTSHTSTTNDNLSESSFSFLSRSSLDTPPHSPGPAGEDEDPFQGVSTENLQDILSSLSLQPEQ